jgi:polyhydroxybutyrate depolymerase
MLRTPFITLLLVFVLVLGALPVRAQEGEIGALDDGGTARTYYLHVPGSYDGSTPVPLVVALHGTSSSGKALAALTGLDAAADQQGFIAVYPNADGSVWGEDPGNSAAPDDLSFIPVLIDHLAQTYAIDPDRVYLTGTGNGGLMAYRLACALPDRFAGVAVVGPLMWERHADACPADAAAPVNILIIHGTDDIFYPHNKHVYESLWSTDRPVILGVDETVGFWVKRDGCDLLDTEMSAQTRVFASCTDGSRVAFYDVQGGRGSWPRTGDYKLNQFGIDATAMILDFFAGGDAWKVTQPPYTGQARTYALYVPTSYDPTVPMPVVVLLHGRWGSGAGTADYTGMSQIAERDGFIGVYPDGLNNPNPVDPYDTGWNYMYGVPFLVSREPDDGAFITDLLDDLALDLNVDQRRIYVTGFSNGGFMVHNLACTYPDRFAAFSTVAGSGYMGFGDMCTHEAPVSMMIIHGTADDNVLWDGRTETISGRDFVTSYPVVDMVSYWVAHDYCDVDTLEVTDLPQRGDSPQTSVRSLIFNDCLDDASVQLYAVIGGGHNWPGVQSDGSSADELAMTNMDINAGELMWNFFKQHALPDPDAPMIGPAPAPTAEATVTPDVTPTR